MSSTIWKKPEDVLDYAIKGEEQAVALYTDLSKTVESPKTRKVLMALATQEVAHKKQLCTMKDNSTFSRLVLDLAEMEARLEPELTPTPDMTPVEAIAFAVQAEKDAEDLYTALAESIADEVISGTFSMLAREERAHARALGNGDNS